MYIESFGHGPDLVMLHGWSMHSGVWRELAEKLSVNYRVHLVDLPGHGHSSWQQDALTAEHLINELAAVLPKHAIWIGWSLGGLISLLVAERASDWVSRLILLAATPKFVASDDWSCAVDATVFEQFAANLDENQSQTLKRFLMLQARGSEHSRETIRAMSETLATQHIPHPQALHAGLDLLLNLDCRDSLQQLTCPVHLMMGDKDTLIPTEMVEQARQMNSTLTVSVIEGAGHAPFISHPELCQQKIEQFIHG